KHLGQAAYVRDADANRDSVINAVDEGLAWANLKINTLLRPLTVTLGVDPAADPDGIGVVQGPQITLVGQTAPRAKLRLDQGADGVFDRQTFAGLGGRYQFTTQVGAAVSHLRVLATDAFGQSATANITVTPTQALHPNLDSPHVVRTLITPDGGTLATI